MCFLFGQAQDTRAQATRQQPVRLTVWRTRPLSHSRAELHVPLTPSTPCTPATQLATRSIHFPLMFTFMCDPHPLLLLLPPPSSLTLLATSSIMPLFQFDTL